MSCSLGNVEVIKDDSAGAVFLLEEVNNWLMQSQFLAPVELFFKQLNGCSF